MSYLESEVFYKDTKSFTYEEQTCLSFLLIYLVLALSSNTLPALLRETRSNQVQWKNLVSVGDAKINERCERTKDPRTNREHIYIHNIQHEWTPSGLKGIVKTREINYIWDKKS